MSKVRTFYWDAKLVQPRTLLQRRKWEVGNAGDLLNPLLIEKAYGADVENVDDPSGRRLLLVGSVAHRIRPGDLVYGVGYKGTPIPSPTEVPCTVQATRGPITSDAYRKAGHDLGGLRFEFDPGLLIPRLMTEIPEPTRGNTIFIPHYRDKVITHKLVGRKAKVVDIDLSPLDLADEVARAELVYSSSLHGLIFAHALGRPAVLVAPRSEEPMIKYQDYYASIGLPWRDPVQVTRALKQPTPVSPVTLPASLADVELPTQDELIRHDLLTEQEVRPI